MFNMIKNWSGWTEAGTIFKARMEMFGSALAAGVAALASYNFLPYLTADKVDLRSVLIVSAYIGVSAMVTEYVRRYNATDI